MEIISLSGLIIIISVCIIAFLIGYFVNTGREDNSRLVKELEESKEELKNYRSEVTSHFQETAQKVNALTENYRSVYEHLALGAQSLCDKSDTPVLMNELNRNPMLGSETVETTEIDHETVSTEASTDTDSGSDSEPEKIDGTPDDTTDIIAAEDQTETTGAETDLENNSAEDPEADKNNGRNSAYPDENKSDDSIIAAEKGAEPDKQTPEQKPAT
jgi:uncharacterized membrane-anchored protein YhcB (DUF1043 family)